jgi:hypothetical protein
LSPCFQVAAAFCSLLLAAALHPDDSYIIKGGRVHFAKAFGVKRLCNVGKKSMCVVGVMGDTFFIARACVLAGTSATKRGRVMACGYFA